VRADRQLGTDDLLGTAAGLRAGCGVRSENAGDMDNPWVGVVLMAADRRCRTVSSRDVALRRLDGRAWGGIALAVAAAVALAVLAGPAGERATSRDIAAGATAVGPRPGPAAVDRPLVVLAADARLNAGPSAASSDEGERFGQDEPDRVAAAPTPDTRPAFTAEPPGSEDAEPTAGGPESTGGASGYGKVAARPGEPEPPRGTPTDPATPAPPATQPDRRTAAASARPAGGGLTTGEPPSGTGSITAGPPVGRTGSAGVDAAPPPAVLPWETDRWAADARAAREQVEAGRVPPAYRDLVRQFFEAW
jgi:hypothetical protein